MLRQLAAFGITGIHDIARVDAISQGRLFPTAVERSTTNLDLFEDLRFRGELTVRVYPILTLATWRELKAHRITPGAGDDMIRYGALKQFVDATLMDAPFANTPNYAGSLSFRVTDEQAVRDDIIAADAAGFDIAAHALGDGANRKLADWYEAAIAKNPARDRRFRFIHAWYPAPREVERAGRMHAIADITPSQLVSELDGMEARLGPARAAYAFPWRSLADHGVRLDIGSDWPGSFDRNTVSPLNPMENIYYAVTRQRVDGTPAGGWRPDQALTVDEAIRAYTINPAYAAHEERVKGSLTAGKLADLVVLDRNIRHAAPRDVLAAKVRLTILGGRVIYAAPGVP
jgi:predicted amidohydrolase YtcJ